MATGGTWYSELLTGALEVGAVTVETGQEQRLSSAVLLLTLGVEGRLSREPNSSASPAAMSRLPVYEEKLPE